MPRIAVQQHEVFAAADALLNRQERPTVERVRLYLGRGSPNTIGPMLDAWYGSLGSRLAGQGVQGLPGVPIAVQDAMVSVWKEAMAQARILAMDEVHSERLALDSERARLEGVAVELQTREAALLSRHQAQEEFVQQLKDRVEGLNQDLETVRVQMSRQSQDMQVLEDKRAQLEATNAQLRARMDQAHLDMEAERVSKEAAARERERYWMLAVDRERTSSKEIGQKLAKAEKQLESLATASERRVVELQAQHGQELKALREQLRLAMEAQRAGDVHTPQAKGRLRPLKPAVRARGRRA